MSDFKIIGNPNPVVGVLEIYTISDFFEKFSSNDFINDNNFSYNPVRWEVYVLELGKWRKTKENDKTGNKVSYTFFEKSLTRKGIRILARKGEKVARIDIKSLPAQPKIDHIELLDKNGAKINGRLSYGQTVKARVFCLNMEKQRVSVTMWEDDIKGAGHNKANEKNYIQTKSRIVKFGKADIDFLLKPSFAKIAERGGHEKDKIHEFYVTAETGKGKIASNNINVNAIETPVAPYKGKTTPEQPVKNKPAEQKPKNDTAKPNTPATSKAVKGKINSVHITDTAGNQIKGVYKEKQIRVLITSTGLIGKEVLLKLYDEDLISNDLLLTKKLTIKSDRHEIVESLDAIPRSLGGNNWAEGDEQELFAEIEVLQTHDFVKSAVIEIDTTVFKHDEFEITNKVLKVFIPEEEEEENQKNICERCNKDFEYDDIEKIFASASKNKGLAEKLIKEINLLRAKYKIDSCLRKVHLINQLGSETGFNTLIEEIDGYSSTTLKNLFGYFKRNPDEADTYKGNLYEIAVRAYGLRKVDKEEDIVSCVVSPSGKCNDLGNENKEEGYKYIGRGLIQLTGKYNYTQINKDFIKAFPGKGDLVKNPELLEEPKYAAMSAFSYWINNNLNSKADLGYNPENVDSITRIINKNLDSNHYEKRRKSFVKAKEIYYLNECKNLDNKSSSTEVIIRLIRKWQTKKSTIGEFTIDNTEITGFMLEEKGPDTTISGIEQRIPIGTYNLVWHNGTKFKNVLKLYNNEVSANRAILIHAGNSAESTEGCLLPGSSRSTDWVSKSKDKLVEINEYVKLIGIENAKIIITEKYE